MRFDDQINFFIQSAIKSAKQTLQSFDFEWLAHRWTHCCWSDNYWLSVDLNNFDTFVCTGMLPTFSRTFLFFSFKFNCGVSMWRIRLRFHFNAGMHHYHDENRFEIDYDYALQSQLDHLFRKPNRNVEFIGFIHHIWL